MPDIRHEFDSRRGREQFEPFDLERPRAPREAVRWIVGKDICFALLIVAGLWLWYLGNSLVSFQEEQLRDTLERRAMIFWIACAGTLGFCLVMPPRIYRRLRLAACGEKVLGKVTAAAYVPVIAGGLTKIHYTYKVRGYWYRKQMSSPLRHQRGDEILLVYDPRRPRHCAPYESIFPPLHDTETPLERFSAEDPRNETALAKKVSKQATDDVLEEFMPSKWWWCKLAGGIGLLLMGIGMLVDPAGWEPRPAVGGRGNFFRVLAELVGMRAIGGGCIALSLFLFWIGYDDLRRWLRRRKT